MDHHVAYLPPPGLPVSTEHSPNPQVSQNSSTSAIIHQNYAMYGHTLQQQAGFILDPGKQTLPNHGRHNISHEGDGQNHGDLRHTYQSDFIGLAKVIESPYTSYGPSDLCKNYQRVVDPTRSNMDFSHGFGRHLPSRTPNDLHMNLQKSDGNMRQTKSFAHDGIHPTREMQLGVANHGEPLGELQRVSPSLQVTDAAKRVVDNQTLRTAKDRREHVASASSFRAEETQNCEEHPVENHPPSSQSGDAATTPWEQIVGVAANRREETMANERSPHTELQVRFPGMETQRRPSPVNPEDQQQTDHTSGLEELSREYIQCSEGQRGEDGEKSAYDGADSARNKDTETTSNRSNLSCEPPAGEGDEVGDGEERANPSNHSVETEDAPKKNINLMVDGKWEEVMRECGFTDSHSDFAEFLVNWYNSNKEKKHSSEDLSSSSGAKDLESTSTSVPEMISKEIQTEYSCSCNCHQEQTEHYKEGQSSKSLKKPKRIPRQRRTPSQQVVIVAEVKEGSPTPSHLPSEVNSVSPRSRSRGRRSSVSGLQDGHQTPAQSRGGRPASRKRKLSEASLPYSPVPIYKTKPSESQARLEGKEAPPTKAGKRKPKVSQRTAVTSSGGDSSSESGVDADDRDSDVDFQPPHHQSDSEDDSKPLKFHLSKLRSRSADKKSSTSSRGDPQYVMEHDNPRAPLKITFKQNRKWNFNAAQTKRVGSQTSSNASRARKPRKPAKPKKAVRAKRPPKAKVRKEERIEMEQPLDDEFSEGDGEQEKEAADAGSKEGGSKSRVKISNRDVIKVSWSELIKQYQCKICQYDTPCITDMSLHLLDSHILVIKELMQLFSQLEATCSSRTASIFEFLSGKKYEEVTSEMEESSLQHKSLPPVSGILSSVLTTQETDSRVPATSEIVMTALSQALPPVTNTMALLHGGPHNTVFGTLGATGALPYITGLTHPTLGDINHTGLHGGTAGYATNFSRGQDGGTVAPNSMDSTVSLLNAAVTSQSNTTSQASSETDGTSASTEGETREKSINNFSESADITNCQTVSTGSYQEKFRKSGVDVEELSKALEADQIIDVFEKWVKIRTQCPHCRRNIRVSKRSNMHRCKGSDSKPVYVLCDVCGNSYQKEYFSLHYNRLHLQSLVPCHICNKKFTASSLPKHLFKHTNPPAAFKCGTCTKSFRFRMDLERHELVHRVDKPYVCATCGRGFTQKSNMQYHMRQHTGERPYKCDNCMKSFTHNVSLKNHLKKHHGIDLWAMGYTGGGRPKKEQRVNPSSNEST